MNIQVAQTLAEFGRSIGLDGLRADHLGRLSLRVGEDGMLSFRQLDEAVLMMLGRPLPVSTQLTACTRALGLVRLSHGWSQPVRAGLTRERELLFITRLSNREFGLHTLEQACDLLTRLHDRVTA